MVPSIQPALWVPVALALVLTFLPMLACEAWTNRSGTPPVPTAAGRPTAGPDTPSPDPVPAL